MRVSEERGQKQVALFIDFENLIYGLNQEHGEQRAYELFSIQPLLELAPTVSSVKSEHTRTGE